MTLRLRDPLVYVALVKVLFSKYLDVELRDDVVVATWECKCRHIGEGQQKSTNDRRKGTNE